MPSHQALKHEQHFTQEDTEAEGAKSPLKSYNSSLEEG